MDVYRQGSPAGQPGSSGGEDSDGVTFLQSGHTTTLKVVCHSSYCLRKGKRTAEVLEELTTGSENIEISQKSPAPQAAAGTKMAVRNFTIRIERKRSFLCSS